MSTSVNSLTSSLLSQQEDKTGSVLTVKEKCKMLGQGTTNPHKDVPRLSSNIRLFVQRPTVTALLY